MLIQKCIDFIQSKTVVPIAVTDRMATQKQGAAWDGIELICGGLFVNPTIAHPGDLLHECGHIVTVPMELRQSMSGWLQGDEADEDRFDSMVAAYWEKNQDEDSVYGDLMHIADDSAATYWGCMALAAMGEKIDPMFDNGFFGIGNLEDYLVSVSLSMDQRWETNLSVAAYYSGLLRCRVAVEPIEWDLAILERTIKRN